MSAAPERFAFAVRRNSASPSLIAAGASSKRTAISQSSAERRNNPLEVLLILRDVRSRIYFEQMKSGGPLVFSETELQAMVAVNLQRTIRLRRSVQLKVFPGSGERLGGA